MVREDEDDASRQAVCRTTHADVARLDPVDIGDIDEEHPLGDSATS